MKKSKIERVCVVGAGKMGQQIALLAAINGYTVKCTDSSENALEKAYEFTEGYLAERVVKEKLTAEEAAKANRNIIFTSSLAQAAEDSDLVIEAVLEKVEIKREIFAQLDSLCPPHTILASNSSFITSSKIVDVCTRPGRVCNMHFFNPALVMKLVEVVQGPHTDQETVDSLMELCRSLGKEPVLLRKEIYGFVVNRILNAINREALFLLEQEVASVEDIDTAVVNGLGHPMGPFKLMDLTGIDLSYYVAMERFKETGDWADLPSPSLVSKYVTGEWGKKTGKGFYKYQ